MNVNDEQLLFYSELGRAITQWAHVERALLEVAFAITPDTDLSVLGHTYFAADSVRGKLNFVQALCAISATFEPHKPVWERLKVEIQRASANRNKLAHRFVMNYVEERRGRSVVLLPFRRDEHAGHRAHPEAIGVQEIVGFRYQFFAVTLALENFSQTLRGAPPRFDTVLESPSAAPSIRDLETMTRSLYEGLTRY